jgi:TIR domain/Protein tyrosine and serine/threonine kinase
VRRHPALLSIFLHLMTNQSSIVFICLCSISCVVNENRTKKKAEKTLRRGHSLRERGSSAADGNFAPGPATSSGQILSASVHSAPALTDSSAKASKAIQLTADERAIRAADAVAVKAYKASVIASVEMSSVLASTVAAAPSKAANVSVSTKNFEERTIPTVPKYGRPTEFGLKEVGFINVHRKEATGRIQLMQGSVEGLAPEDETDLLIVYLRQRGAYKANQDSALAALNRSGLSLHELERETKPQPSYRRHYHCWLSRPLPKPRPKGFEFKRLLVYEDPGEELTRDDNIVLDIMKCLTTVIGGDVQISSVMIPLSGALLSPALRKHFVKASVEVTASWMQMGLPVKEVKILLPADADISKDIETFEKMKTKLTTTTEYQIRKTFNHDVFFSYAQGDKDAASEMMEYLRSKNPCIRIFDAEPREVSVRQRGVVNLETTEAINQSRIFLSLVSDDYFHSVECTEAFSLAYCRDFDSQGNFIIPLFWRSCDLTPLARRLVATAGVDCRETSFDSAKMLLEEILSALDGLDKVIGEEHDDMFDDGRGSTNGAGKELNLADKLLMAKEVNVEGEAALFDKDIPAAETEVDISAIEDSVSAMFFDESWRSQWACEFQSIVFGPRIGAGGFGEVYKCKWENRMVAVKTLQKIEDDDPDAVMAEFMVEMKLMSKLRHCS